MENQALKGLKAAMMALLLTLSVHAGAAVTISNVSTGDGDETLFGTSHPSIPAPLDPGLNPYAGEWYRFPTNAFIAQSTAVGDLAVVQDSLSFLLTAHTGFVISAVRWMEAGQVTNISGLSTSSGSVTIDGKPNNFPMVINQSNTDSPWSFAPRTIVGGKESVQVDVTNVIIAIALAATVPAPTEKAFIEKNFAAVGVELTAIPLPPAIWLMGAAIIGLTTVGRRKYKAQNHD